MKMQTETLKTNGIKFVIFFVSLFICMLFFIYNNNSSFKFQDCNYLDNIRKIVYSPHIEKSNPITLVTAYFPLSKSKHSTLDYNTWIENFLPKIETPIIIYTVGRMVLKLSKLRGNKPTKFVLYDSIWDVPVMSQLKSTYEKQHEKDPEKKIHSPELYAIWNSKAWMLSNAADFNVFGSSYFFWVDIGCFRVEHQFKFWPDLPRVQSVFENSSFTDKIHLFTVNGFNSNWNMENDTEASAANFFIGGFYGGKYSAIKWFSQVFYDLHNKLLAQGHFVGKDQSTMTRLGINPDYTDRIIVTCSCTIEGYNSKFCKRIFLYFQDWYASELERSEKCQLTGCHNLKQFLETY